MHTLAAQVLSLMSKAIGISWSGGAPPTKSWSFEVKRIHVCESYHILKYLGLFLCPLLILNYSAVG